MGKKMSRQHEVLRVPNGWTEQDKALVMQLERIHDDLYNRLTKAVTGQVFSVLGITPNDDGDVALTESSLTGIGVVGSKDIGIVETGDTATHNISKGQYVIWKGSLYTASAVIAAGDTLSVSNLTAVSNGGLNSLAEDCPEIVSNTNGVAYKYPNGFMVCTKSVQKAINMNSGWGNLYEGSVALGDWAVPFISNPIVSVQNANSTGAIVESGGSNATSAGTWWFCRPNSVTNVTVDVHAIAYGRWK